MILEKISIKNFRNIITEQTIVLSNYTILVGKNNEGKTNVLSAICVAVSMVSQFVSLTIHSPLMVFTKISTLNMLLSPIYEVFTGCDRRAFTLLHPINAGRLLVFLLFYIYKG